MKTITKASVIFYLLDEINKRPISDAIITCKGHSFASIRKDDGNYVFTDIAKGEYVFIIQKPGFLSKEYQVSISDVQPVMTAVTMQFSLDNPVISNMKKIIFTLKNGDKIVPSKEVSLKVDIRNPYLRVIEPVIKGSYLMKLNSDFDPRLLYQEYRYDQKTNISIFFSGYDHENKAYILSTTYKSKIPESGLLNPIWSFKTDSKGRFLFIINPVFMLKDKIEATLTIDKKVLNIVSDVNKMDNYINLDMKQ